MRRTSEIALIDPNDYESILAKYGINGFWTEEAFVRHDKIRNMLEKVGIPVPGWWDELAKKKAVVFYEKEKKWFDSYEEAMSFSETANGYVSYPANPGRSLEHRRMSNNSIAFTEKPSREFLNLVFEIMRGEGEPGFVNLRELAMRRMRSMGIINPPEEYLQSVMLSVGMNPCASFV